MIKDNLTDYGWEKSYIRTVTCTEFFNALPIELQNIIGTTIKYTDNTDYTTISSRTYTPSELDVTSTKDKIFFMWGFLS